MSRIPKKTSQEKPFRLIRDNTLLGDFVLVDGQGRSGKTMLGVILSTMDRVEKLRIDTVFDYVPRYYSLGKMSHNAAVTALKIEADEKLYYTMISRGVNFRFDDYSSVFKDGHPYRYLKRLVQKAEEPAVERIKRERPIFQNLTHDALHLASLYFDAFGDKLKIIYIIRDPIENIYEQGRRNFGERIGKDPREFQLAYEWKGECVPLNAEGWEDDYLSSNATERLVGMVSGFFKKNLEGYLHLDDKWKKQIVFLEFEKFVVEPMKYINQLENFLGTKITRRTKKVLKREKCPRKLDGTLREKKIRDIEEKLSPKFKTMLRNTLKEHEKRLWESF